MNNRNYAMTVYNGSWRVDPVTDFSIGINPDWGDENTVDLPQP